MEIWGIDINSDECPYQDGPLIEGEAHRCYHPASYHPLSAKGGYCFTEERCPLRIQPSNPTGNIKPCSNCGSTKVMTMNYCADCGKEK